MSVVRIDVTPDPAHVRVVRLVAVSLARLNGISEEAVEDVRLAVGEACGRAVAAQARVDLETPVVVDFA
jgi:anti-sigma regulatory factor (Ser/Thr protein kinase)